MLIRILCFAVLCLSPVLVLAQAAEPAHPLQVREGRPVLVRPGGTPFVAAYSETYGNDRFHARNIQFAEAGVDLFVLVVQGGYQREFGSNYFWRGPGEYGDESDRDDHLPLNKQAAAILEANPNAWFIVRWMPIVPGDFRRARPGHLQRASDGTLMNESSYASEEATQGLAEMARRIVRYCEAQTWADRVVGYAAFPLGEGLTELATRGYMFDQSPIMVFAFREYLRQLYQNDKALREAWQDPTVSLRTVVTPTDEEWRADRKQWMHWPDPSKTQRYRDYFNLHRELMANRTRSQLAAMHEAAGRPVMCAIDGMKQPMLGWQLQDAFNATGTGPDTASMHLASGAFNVGPWLDWPELEALITPADYTARTVGFGFEAEGLSDSLVLRGKTIFVEDDARSWITGYGSRNQGAWRNADEGRGGLMRNFGLTVTRGMFPYWMNVGRGFFDDEQVMALVKEGLPTRRRVMNQPWTDTPHAIAMIIDDASPLDEDFTTGFQHLAVLRQRVNELALAGLPYRIHLFSDLERHDFPQYRCYLLPNLFKLTPERIKLVREKLLRNGSIVICGPGTGISDGSKISAEPASELLGIPLTLHEKEASRFVLVTPGQHPALADLQAPVTYGDSFVYGPILVPEAMTHEPPIHELGRVSSYFMINNPGLLLREFGKGAGSATDGKRGPDDAAVVFSMATPMPAALLRSLAIHAGCNPWAALGDAVGASAETLAVHSARPGDRMIRLPQASDVTDADTGEVIARNATAFPITLGANQTRIFMLKPAGE